MKEFTSAVQEIEVEDAVEERVAALMSDGLTREQAEEKAREEIEKPVPFKVDGRVLKAYKPEPGQLAFMMASMGRGQTADGRFAAIINIMLECLRPGDKDYLESRLATRDKKKRLDLKVLEGIFEYLTEEWFRDESSEGSEAV